MQTDDWRGEHLIRTPKKITAPQPIPYSSSEFQQKVAAGREADAALIRPLASKHTRAEIHRITGLGTNRIYDLCRTFKIAPKEPVSSPKKKSCTPAVTHHIALQDQSDTPNDNASEPSP